MNAITSDWVRLSILCRCGIVRYWSTRVGQADSISWVCECGVMNRITCEEGWRL